MRHALASLIAAAAAASTAMAQEAVVTTAEPAATTTTATTETPAGVVTTTVTNTPAATIATSVTTPSPDVAPPAPAPAPAVVVPAPAVVVAPVPAVVAPEPAPALPPTPNDPTTLQTLNVLENVCKPMIAGGDIQKIAKPLGFKKKRQTWVLNLEKPASITVTPSAANPNVCNFHIMHPLGGDKDITVGLHNWAIAQGFTLYRNDAFTTDLKRHTRSWELTKDGRTQALVLVTETKPDGSSTERRATRSTVMYMDQ